MFSKDLLKNGDYEYLIAIRREIHEHPEIGFDLKNTLNIVKRELDNMGIVYTEKYGISSIVATLNPECTGKTVALRADMDALPVTENTGLPFSSKNEGAMHACGHDAHTAMLLCTARMLSRVKEKLNCKVLFIFQAAEEGPVWGASKLTADGITDIADCFAALHVTNNIEAGHIGVQLKESFASCHSFELNFKGHAAHAATPQLSCDALAMAVKAYNDIYLLTARCVSPISPFTISIGSIQAGHTHNVIAEKAKMLLCVRSYDMAIDSMIAGRIKLIANNAATEMGGKCEIIEGEVLPPLINDTALANRLKDAAHKVVGEDKTHIIEPYLSSEDFAFYIQKKPGVMFRIGTRCDKTNCNTAAHGATFMIDESGLINGSLTTVQFVLDLSESFI